MSLEKLVDLVHSPIADDWTERNKEVFEGLFGNNGGRYPASDKKALSLRAPRMQTADGVSYAAYIHSDNPTSGPYSGLSFVIFPIADGPCLVGLVVGTQGLAPDEAILGRPGHARKALAITSWLNNKFGHGKRIAWSKHDPTQIDASIPSEVKEDWSAYGAALKKYGPVVYALFAPSDDVEATRLAITALLDLMMEERGIVPLSAHRQEAVRVKDRWFQYLLPKLEPAYVSSLLDQRGYVVIQGPPGTGKTRLATQLLAQEYEGRGETIQFHPNTTYENFIGGLAPAQVSDGVGFQFVPTRGFLMNVIALAIEQPEKNFLLHIDEINRADLGKILGEAILLLEWKAENPRSVMLPYDFSEPIGRRITMPPNLRILGTMNTADRSIAIVDVAVRRRFGFLSMWPDPSVVQANSCELMQKAFREIMNIFVEYASEDAFQLFPGHAYFLETDDLLARTSLKTNLVPLLEEYLAQGFVGGFAEPIRSYLQWLRALEETR